MRVLVTGATGFLGGAVLRRLARLGLPAIGLGRDPARLAALHDDGLTALGWDMTGPLPDTAALTGISAVVHCAALSSPFGRRADFMATNTAGTQAVLTLAERLGVARFVHISSPSIYFALRDHLDQHEDVPLPRPFNAYADSKRRAEALVLAAPSLGPVILRPRGIYGAGDRSLLPRLLRAARSGPLPLFRQGAARIDLTHVDDVVAAILAALEARVGVEGQAFNISGGEVLPIRHIVAAACAQAGLMPRWRRLPLRPALWAAGLVEAAALALPSRPEPPVTRYGLGLFAYAQSLNIAKANRLLNWSPQVPFAEGLPRSMVP